MDCINGFDIRLEKDVFYPSETLNGVVMLETNAPIRLRGIRIFLRGRARVQWKMLKSGESRTLKDDQYLLDEKLLLWGRDRHDGGVGTNADDEDAQSQILPRGTHEFSFSFRLAGTQMPSSLETKAGTVRYYVKLYYVLRLHVEEGGRKVSVLNMATAPPSSAPTPSGAGNAALEMDFPLTVATVPFRPGHSQLYSVGYDFCVDHVETGKYISPEFRLGQVWDGRADGEKDFVDDVVLYRPVYVKVLDRTPNVAPFKTRESLPPPPPPSLQHLPNGANANHETNHPPTNFPPIENGH